MIAPCKNCTERNSGCHDYCDKYQMFKREKEKEKRDRDNFYLRNGYGGKRKY